MKNLPILLLGLLFAATVALFAQSSPPVSDDEPNEQIYWSLAIMPTYAPAQIEPDFSFVSKFRERVAKTISLNTRLSNYQTCVRKWNYANRCKIQI